MDAYGYNALSGFFGSSSRKDKKKEEIAYLEKMYNLQNQQMQAEEQARFQSQQLIDQSYKIAEQLTTGDHTRKSDKEAVEKISQDLLAPINEKIRLAGGYMKAKRLGIDQDLRDYQYSLSNNDKVHQIKQTQDAIAKIVQAGNSQETRNLVPITIREKFAQWQNEEIDSFTWDGMTDSEIKMDFAKEMTNEQQIGVHNIIAANPGLVNDFYRDLIYQGVSEQDAMESFNYASQDPSILVSSGYLNRRLNPGQKEIIGAFGEKQIETSLGQELDEIQIKMFPQGGAAGGEIINAGGMANYVKENGWADRIESTIGLDQKNPNLMAKDGFILDSGGKIGTVGQIDQKIFMANYSDRLYEKNGEWYLKSEEGGAEGLYNNKGSYIEDASWMDATTDDMKIRGLYLGTKCSYFNMDTQQEESFLLTEAVSDLDPTVRAKKMNELIKSTYSNVNFTPAYVAQLEERDFLNDDVYYDEVIIQGAELAALNDDEALNNALGESRNIKATLKNEQIQSERTAKMEIATLTSLDNIYAGSNPGGFKVIANAYEIPFRTVANTSGMSNKMIPYIMADMFEQASIEAQMTGNTNTKQILDSYVANFNTLAEANPKYYKLLKSGDEQALREYQEKQYGKNWSKMKKRYTLWNRYFNK